MAEKRCYGELELPEVRVQQAPINFELKCECCDHCYLTLEFLISDCEGNPLDNFVQNKADVLNVYGAYSIVGWHAFILESVGADTWLQVITVAIDCDLEPQGQCNPTQL